MSTSAQGVTVGVDGRSAGQAALSYAVREAQRRGVPLTLVRAWDPPVLSDGVSALTVVEVERAEAAVLRAAADRVEELAPGLPHTEHLVAGRREAALVKAGAHAALLVLGRHAGSSAWLGPLVGHVATRCACPVVVLPADAPDSEGPVVVGVDGSEVSARAVAHAFEHAARWGTEVTAVLAVAPGSTAYAPDPALLDVVHERGRRELSEALAGTTERYPEVRLTQLVVLEDPFRALLDAAEGASLLVVGSHGRGAVLRWALGSVSSSLLRAARCPVAVVRPDPVAAPRPRAAAPAVAAVHPYDGLL